MLDNRRAKERPGTTWMDVYRTVPKPEGARLLPAIKNYKLIKKGTAFATVEGNPIVAKKNFYPILFGKNSYKEIFGFSARLLK